MLNRSKLKLVVLMCLLVTNTVTVFAQATDEGPEPPPSSAPINDWIPYVVVAVVFLVLVKFFAQTRKTRLDS